MIEAAVAASLNLEMPVSKLMVSFLPLRLDRLGIFLIGSEAKPTLTLTHHSLENCFFRLGGL